MSRESQSSSSEDHSDDDVTLQSPRDTETDLPSIDASSKKKGARSAYASGDSSMSINLHKKKVGAAPEKHTKGAEHIKSGVFGAIDGIITTFSVVSGAVGGSLGSNVILILGFSNLVSDGLSMGLGDFISSQAEYDYAKAEMRREKWEFENYSQGEKDEMVEIYRDKGLSKEDATELVEVLAKNKNNFIDTMMVEELGMLPPSPDESPAMGGLVTFLAFLIFGIIPLLPYVIGEAIAKGTQVPANNNALFGIAIGLVAVALFTLGAVTSKFTIHTWYKAGMYMLIVGAVAAGSSYLIGWGVDSIVKAIGDSSAGTPAFPTSPNCTGNFSGVPAPAPLG
jgi:VIT1/CCC1 family predicted Fe2+/Mn2+ transporter